MKKRILSMLLTFVLLVGLLPVNAVAVTKSLEEQIRAEVTQVIMDYAEAVKRSGADDDAFWQYANHGFYGKGKFLQLKESDPMVASLFNAKLMQAALIDAITEGVVMSQQYGRETILLEGGPGWHQARDNYYYVSYSGETDAAEKYLGREVTYRVDNIKTPYNGPLNEHDDVMHWLVGGLEGHMHIRPIAVSENTVTYDVELNLWDSFDFHNNYNTMKEQGYNVTADDRLRKVGLLMTYMGLDEFEWGYDKHFTIEVPYECSHTYESFAWHQDYASQTLQTITGDGFRENPASTLIHTYRESTFPYYALSETVRLRYDRPWVVEVESDYLYVGLAPHRGVDSALNLQIRQYDSVVIRNHEYSYTGEEESISSSQAPMWYVEQFAGVNLKQFAYSSKYDYSCRVENVLAADGSNMIYVTIINDTLGEVAYGPEPIVERWSVDKNADECVALGDDPTYIVGKDIYVNYVGNAYMPLANKNFNLKIWENGKDGSGASCFEASDKASTCTEQGGVVMTCRDCGYSYMTDVVPATGHSFGDYAFDNNASCTADGTQTRKCTVCGVGETIAAPDTATGHSYKGVVTEPTYTEQGYTTYTCTVCGDSYKDDYTAVKKHSYVGVVTEATCVEQGYTTYTCSECGDVYVDDYTELAEHTPVIDPYVAPTCVEKGKMEGSHCGVCGLVLKKQALISTVDTHRMEESITKMPTYDEPGEVAYICQDCGKTDYMEIPALDKPEPVNPFTDVNESDWFYNSVLWAVQEGVTGGKTATTFAPNEGCTRAQVVTFLWAANGKLEPKSLDNPFTDVSDDAWYLKPVLWAVENDITTGISATEFGPEQTCTRAQIATFLYAAAGKPEVKGNSTFVDVADGDWYAVPIIWAKENDITGGIGEGKFGPNDTCTRAQVVTFLNKVYNK